MKSSFVEPATMCMESSYWRNQAQHRQSTPTTFGGDHQPDVARHHSLGQLAYTSVSQTKYDRLVLFCGFSVLITDECVFKGSTWIY